jgi:hypothetical protein
MVAEKSVTAFEKLAKESNTLIMPADLSPVNSLVVQAMSVYKQLQRAESSPNSSSRGKEDR